MDELYGIAAIVVVLGGIFTYVLESRRDEKLHEELRDLRATDLDHRGRIVALETKQEAREEEEDEDDG